jgi:fibronectin-binding autotransporter adhesin
MARWGYLVAAATAFVGLANGVALAQVDYTNWNPALTGNQLWQVDGNWSPATFPDDPGRVDSDAMTILNVVGANVSVGLGSNLNLSVGESDVTVAVIKLGGTSGPVTTTISAGTGGRLVMENNEQNYVVPSPTPGLPDDVTPSYNYSNALIVSGGVAGSTNVITAPILIRDVLEVGSYDTDLTTNDLTISGPILFENTDRTTVLSMKAAGHTLTITGNQVVDNLYPATTGANPPDFAFNESTSSAGTLLLQGNFSGTGGVQIGPRTGGSGAQYILSGDNSGLTGGFSLGRGDFHLMSNNALGTTGSIKQNSNTGQLGVNLYSDNDTRVISAPVQLAQFVTIKGENSITFSGTVAQTNSRGWVNLLPAGKTLFLTGTQAADDQSPADTNPIPAGDTIYMFDGSGKTVVTGLLKDHLRDDLPENANAQRSFGIRGTGAVYLQGSTQAVPKLSTYRGFTYVQGGNLHLGTGADLGSSQKIKSTGGAIGLDNGTATGPDTGLLLGKLNNRAQVVLSPQGDIVRTDDYATGGLMLAASESSANLNFTTTLANAADMTVAAPEQGMSYTGTVTPANSTYRFGGGSGVITLPNANQLTGGNSLVVMNGHDFGDRQGLGGVRITANNNYTGTTLIRGRNMTTNQDAAAVNAGVVGAGDYNGTTLTVTSLANGGSASGIGSSTNAAANLHIQGGTLRYEGAATSTDRLFTIGTRGATLDASGTGALTFSNTGALTIDTAEARLGKVNGFAFSFQAGVTAASTSVAYGIADTSDIVPGMQIANQYLTESGTDTDTVITVTGVPSPNRVSFSDPINLFAGSGTPSNITFIDVERTFTLTGNNSGNNTLRPIIADSATNVVNVAKTGSGKWILDAVNTYSGDTSVEAGILSITKSYLSDTADVMIDSGAIFDLSFVGSDTIGALFLDGASQGLGTYGSLASAATFKSSYFTGTGILNVTELVLTAIPGDYNNDGIVNAADYTVYRDNVGQPGGTLVNDPAGGVVGAAQYTQWATNYGATEPPASLSVSVPEPTALLLAGIAAAGLLSLRKAA